MSASMSPILSAYNIPSITSRPSLSCLQWSGDGQVFFLTKGSVYILTPDRGVHLSAQLPGNVQDSHVNWFSTMIDFNPRDVHSWPAGTQEWGAISLGSMDVGLRAISCSPSNLTGNGGCVAAILSSNMDFSFWHTPKNTIRGEWVKLYEATPFIAELTSQEPYSKAEQTIRSQITSLSWSSHADFDVSPAPRLNSSLLVTGTRAGTLMFLRFKNSALEHVATHEVSDQWITHLAFSSWTAVAGEKSEIKLAYGIADGSVGLMKITQSLYSVPSSTGFSLDFTIQTHVEKISPIILQPDNTGITALSWIFPPGNMILVRNTPGVVSLWSGNSTSTLSWSGHRSLRLCTQKLSVGSSSLQPVSGLHYVAQEDALLVSLFDGSIHVIRSLTKEPGLANTPSLDELTSQGLSRFLRSAFTRTEKEKVSKRDVNRVSGMIPYDGSSVVLWVQESSQPSNFDYRYDVLHESTFVGKRDSLNPARLLQPPPHDVFLRELSSILMTKASLGATPLHLLRPIFLRLQDLLAIQPRVLETLLEGVDRYPPSPILAPWPSESGPQLRAEFRKSLNLHMFGCNVLHSLRLRFAYYSNGPSQRNIPDLSKADEFDDAAQQLLRTISFIVLTILCRHLSAVVTCLQENDIPFLMRIALQSSHPCAPSELRSDAEILLDAVSSHIPSFSREAREKEAMEEICPACGLVVYFDGDSDACPNGHTWGRCTVTSFILSTPMLRTCTGCTRKTFLPRSCYSAPEAASSWLPPAAASWVVEELLEAVSRCLFCGNNLVSLF
ncbi:transcription factor IIIC subunit delta N-term-domain-containing protein [Mycena latifolia]|nr:transcription factor IIIC subunit delta N-term-domain-containing protein [Mycena latifolia]